MMNPLELLVLVASLLALGIAIYVLGRVTGKWRL